MLLVVVAALVVSYASSLRAFVDQRGQIAALREQNATSAHDITALKQQIASWNDPAYVRAQAKERFGWVLPGETGYVVIDNTGRPATDAAAQPAARPATPWWDALVGSVRTADKPPPPATKSAAKTPVTRIGPDGKPVQVPAGQSAPGERSGGPAGPATSPAKSPARQ